jgi:hypothetical protein
MTTRTHLFALCAALLLASPLAAGGRRDYVSVAFASAKDQKTLHDGGLDGSVKFYWSNEGGPKGEEVGEGGHDSLRGGYLGMRYS